VNTKRENLSGQQLQALELLANGEMNKDVAAEIGVTPQTISNWKRKDDLFIAELEATLRRKLDKAVPKAIKTMIELMDSNHPQIRFAAAKDILDRRGIKAPERVEHTGAGGNPIMVADVTSIMSEAEKAQLIMNAARAIEDPEYEIVEDEPKVPDLAEMIEDPEQDTGDLKADDLDFLD